MAGPVGLVSSAASWFAGLLAVLFFPQTSSTLVRIISGVFIVLGLAFVLPILLLVAFDIGLWLWRLYAVSRRAQLRQHQIYRQQAREARQKRETRLRQLRESHAEAMRQRRPPAEAVH